MNFEYLSKTKLSQVRSLTSRKNREKLGLTIVEGEKNVVDTLQIESVIKFIIFNEDAETQLRPIFELAQSLKIPCFKLNNRDFKSISDTSTPQNALAIARFPKFLTLDELREKKIDRLLILDNLQDPGNVGALLRTAAAFEVDAIVATKGSAELTNPKVVRASAGTLWRLNLCANIEPEKLLAFLTESDFKILLADPSGESYFKREYPKRWALVLGNEGRGLSQVFTRGNFSSSARIAVKHSNSVDSLNVAIAGAIILAHLYNRT